MEMFVFEMLQEKGKKAGIDIFEVEQKYNSSCYIVKYHDGEINFNTHKLVEKEIEANALDTLDDVISKIKLQNPKKPPLGIKPHFIWVEQRIEDIKQAINRRIEAGTDIPHKWYVELAQLENEKIENTTQLIIKADNFTEKDLDRLKEAIGKELLNTAFKLECY